MTIDLPAAAINFDWDVFWDYLFDEAIMRGALRPDAKKLHQNYYLPMTTAMAVALFE